LVVALEQAVMHHQVQMEDLDIRGLQLMESRMVAVVVAVVLVLVVPEAVVQPPQTVPMV
jgi:competence protein ComGC